MDHSHLIYFVLCSLYLVRDGSLRRKRIVGRGLDLGAVGALGKRDHRPLLCTPGQL